MQFVSFALFFINQKVGPQQVIVVAVFKNSKSKNRHCNHIGEYVMRQLAHVEINRIRRGVKIEEVCDPSTAHQDFPLVKGASALTEPNGAYVQKERSRETGDR